MHVGIAYPRWRGNFPGIPGACATRNITYLIRCPCDAILNTAPPMTRNKRLNFNSQMTPHSYPMKKTTFVSILEKIDNNKGTVLLNKARWSNIYHSKHKYSPWPWRCFFVYSTDFGIYISQILLLHVRLISYCICIQDFINCMIFQYFHSQFPQVRTYKRIIMTYIFKRFLETLP